MGQAWATDNSDWGSAATERRGRAATDRRGGAATCRVRALTAHHSTSVRHGARHVQDVLGIRIGEAVQGQRVQFFGAAFFFRIDSSLVSGVVTVRRHI